MSYVDEPELNPYAAPASKIAEAPSLDSSQYIGYAGFWTRFLALFIDGFVILAGEVVILLGAGVLIGLSGNQQNPMPFIVVAYLIIFVFLVCYYAGMESSSVQATLGKMAVGIKVTDLYGRRISFGRSFGRCLGKLLISGLFLIGYLMAAFTEKKQVLHDMMAGTLVLKTR